jgi:two-component system, NarL family, response regulator NreC
MEMTKKSKEISVVIAEDHQSYSDMLVKTLQESNIHCLKQARNGLELLSYLKNGVLPDIVLLDISMPELDGSTVLPEILNMYPSIKIIVISQYQDSFVIDNFFQRGVKAYIPKSQNFEQLVEAILRVYEGEVYRGNLVNVSRRASSSEFARTPRFTPRELSIIKLIIDGKTNKEIGDELLVSIKTVELDRTHIYEKANVKSLPEFIRFVNSSGWYYMDAPGTKI